MLFAALILTAGLARARDLGLRIKASTDLLMARQQHAVSVAGSTQGVEQFGLFATAPRLEITRTLTPRVGAGLILQTAGVHPITDGVEGAPSSHTRAGLTLTHTIGPSGALHGYAQPLFLLSSRTTAADQVTLRALETGANLGLRIPVGQGITVEPAAELLVGTGRATGSAERSRLLEYGLKLGISLPL